MSVRGLVAEPVNQARFANLLYCGIELMVLDYWLWVARFGNASVAVVCCLDVVVGCSRMAVLVWSSESVGYTRANQTNAIAVLIKRMQLLLSCWQTRGSHHGRRFACANGCTAASSPVT